MMRGEKHTTVKMSIEKIRNVLVSHNKFIIDAADYGFGMQNGE